MSRGFPKRCDRGRNVVDRDEPDDNFYVTGSGACLFMVCQNAFEP
jgi:hypothetical protein